MVSMEAGLRAILSVYDKTGLVEFAQGLAGLGFELVASGGTAGGLAAARLAVTPVEDITGFPELLGGRVKTLHPAVHGGILARRIPEHLQELTARGIAPIDLVVCNLYPFAATIARPGVTDAEAIEEIDIGGVTLLRAAAKNFEAVLVVCDPADYADVLEMLRAGEIPVGERRRLAVKAFTNTATYDASIAEWLAGEQTLPETLVLAAERVQALRYGENPHQEAALYRWVNAKPAFEQLQGKELSYNNIVDLEAAWAMPQEFAEPAVAIIKHTNPSGLAVAGSAVEAYRLAYECDPMSAFGGIIACNRPVDLAFVEAVGGLFVEVLVAPDYAEEALAAAGGAQEELPGDARSYQHNGTRARRLRNGARACLAVGMWWIVGANCGRSRGRRVDVAGGDEACADRGRTKGAWVCVDRSQAHQVERNRAGPRDRGGRRRCRADEPGRFGAPGSAPRGGPGTGSGAGVGRLLPLPRRRGGGCGGRSNRDHPARRVGARCRMSLRRPTGGDWRWCLPGSGISGISLA